jgi:integrase
MARPGTYLYKKPGSKKWWVQFQYPGDLATKMGRRRIRKSLNTSDREKAQETARSLIFEHKKFVYLSRVSDRVRAEQVETLGREPTEEEHWEAVLRKLAVAGARLDYTHKLGLTDHGDGTTTFATKDRVWRMINGVTQAPVPNEPIFKIPPGVFEEEEATDLSKARTRAEASAPKPAEDPDEKLFKLWVRHNNVKPAIQADARRALDAYKEVVRRPFARATRLDGQKLAEHFLSQGNKRATVVKKVGHLGAICEVAIHFGRLKSNLNPFHAVVPNLKDADRRDIITEEEMAVMRGKLHTLREDQQLLWMLIATTGMRRGEAWDIMGEQEEDGLRKVRIGTKSPQSDRWIPLPEAVLPYLPAKIEGSLFSRKPEDVGKSLIKSMRRLGIRPTQPGTKKDLHSLRHRAKDRLRIAECPQDMQEWLLGHEEKTAADGYGKGPSMRQKAKWIAHIGY